MKNFLNRIFCNHEYILIRWHWTHGPTACDPRMIEAECKCRKCNKMHYVYPDRGGKLEEWFIKCQKEKQQ